ncbi:ABC transporter substrate-binding protein [Nonomuraea insulae]|uniref:ABC transporter substrate-binding protein n=1 Tax=Nonomuraea insulae TaxID=1616787 RepID=A0ABW1D6F4_9ACTN
MKSQNLLPLLLGGALLKISAFSTDFTNYVKPGARPLLIAAGAVLVILAVATLIEERRKSTLTARQALLAHANWVKGQQAELAANPYYYGAAPAYEKIVVRVIPDANARVAMSLVGATTTTSHHVS